MAGFGNILYNLRSIKRKLKKIDISINIAMTVIVVLSFIFVYSATINKTNIYFIKEIIWVILGLSLYLFFSLINYKILAKYSKTIYILNIILLTLALVLGHITKGAKRWIHLGAFKLQPSEFAKLFIVLTLAELLTNGFAHGVRGWKGMIRVGLHILIPFLLILKEPDLGTSLVIMFLYFVIIFVSNVDMKPFLSLIGMGFISLPFAFSFMKKYQKDRILMFLNPAKDATGRGWNIIQSKIAVGSGRIFGKGIFQGTQNKLKFLPESHTDFIFAVLAEELGFIGSSFLVLIYLWLVLRIIYIGKNTNDNFGKLVCYGFASVIFFHTLVNIGMVIGIMPVTGVPLLLMSYGGSSFIVTLTMLGIVQSIKINS